LMETKDNTISIQHGSTKGIPSAEACVRATI
jgi:hypothetical protein